MPQHASPEATRSEVESRGMKCIDGPDWSTVSGGGLWRVLPYASFIVETAVLVQEILEVSLI